MTVAEKKVKFTTMEVPRETNFLMKKHALELRKNLRDVTAKALNDYLKKAIK